MGAKRFIISDNQELTATAIKHLIPQHSDAESLQANDKAQLISLLSENADSAVVLDFTLFDFADIDSLLIVSERFPQASWVLIADEMSEQLIRRATVESKVMSIVFKECPLLEINDALNAASQGQRYLCPKAMEILLSHTGATDSHELLTATEMEIAKAIAQGKSTKEIAAERFSSVHTITTHRKNIFRKLGVNTAHEVMRYALRAGWIDSAEFYI
ncbi:MAG: response regulator transcription factor [Bacteroidales bacterium]|nr:response regulator transcription factor [Bacteroidales bacterium]